MSLNVRQNGGLAARLGGVLIIALFGVLTLAESGGVESLDFVATHWFFHILQAPVYALLAVGVAGLLTAQKKQAGRLGKVGAYMAIFGFTFGVAGGVFVPIMELGLGYNGEEGAMEALVHMPEFMPYVIGTMLFAIATLRAGVLPRGRAVLLLVGAFFTLTLGFAGLEGFVRMVPLFAFGLGYAALGQALIDRQREHTITRQPVLAS